MFEDNKARVVEDTANEKLHTSLW